MNWAPGSPEWNSFIESAGGEDVYRLAEYLQLEWFDHEYVPHARQLVTKLDHPGVLLWGLTYQSPSGTPQRMGHTVFEPYLRPVFEPHPQRCRGLHQGYLQLAPELTSVFVDTRQSPRATI